MRDLFCPQISQGQQELGLQLDFLPALALQLPLLMQVSGERSYNQGRSSKNIMTFGTVK